MPYMFFIMTKIEWKVVVRYNSNVSLLKSTLLACANLEQVSINDCGPHTYTNASIPHGDNVIISDCKSGRPYFILYSYPLPAACCFPPGVNDAFNGDISFVIPSP